MKYNNEPYDVVTPQADNETLAAKGARVILRHVHYGLHLATPELFIAPKGKLQAGWVIGLIAPARQI